MVELLRGKIASGKSFYAERQRAERRVCVLRTDELFEALNEGACGGREKRVEAERRILAYFCELSAKNDLSGIDTIIDHGFWTKAEVEFAESFFEARGVPYRLIEFEAPFEERLKRLGARGSFFGADRLRSFDSFFEY